MRLSARLLHATAAACTHACIPGRVLVSQVFSGHRATVCKTVCMPQSTDCRLPWFDEHAVPSLFSFLRLRTQAPPLDTTRKAPPRELRLLSLPS